MERMIDGGMMMRRGTIKQRGKDGRSSNFRKYDEIRVGTSELKNCV